METTTATLLSRAFNRALDSENYTSEFHELLNGVENQSLDDIENLLIHAMKPPNVKCRSTTSIPKRAYFWSLVFQKELHCKIFNRSKSFVGLLVENKNFNVLIDVLQYNTKRNLRDTGCDGNTIWHHLCENKCGTRKVKFHESYQKCVFWLLKNYHAVDINALNHVKKTAMDLAVEKKNKDAAKLLIEAGFVFQYPKERHESFKEKIRELVPDVTLRDSQLSEEGLLLPKLRYELMKKNLGNFEADFELFMATKATSFEEDDRKMLLTILLQEACKGGLTEPVQLLLKNGADPNEVDKFNDCRSAIAVAEELGHKRILPLLRAIAGPSRDDGSAVRRTATDPSRDSTQATPPPKVKRERTNSVVVLE